MGLISPRQTCHFQTFKNSYKLIINEGLRERRRRRKKSMTISEAKWFRVTRRLLFCEFLSLPPSKMFLKGNSGCLQVPHMFWKLQRLCLAVLYNNCQRGKASKKELILLKKNLREQGPVSLYEAARCKSFLDILILMNPVVSADVLMVGPQEYVHWSMLHSALTLLATVGADQWRTYRYVTCGNK